MERKNYHFPLNSVELGIVRTLRNNMQKAAKEGDEKTVEKCKVALSNYSVKV